ncbi:hypothetical protein ACOMHN_013821 [Nucella lapillus]
MMETPAAMVRKGNVKVPYRIKLILCGFNISHQQIGALRDDAFILPDLTYHFLQPTHIIEQATKLIHLHQ